MSAIEHQDEIVWIGGVDRLDRGVGDGIEGSAIVVLAVNRKGPPFQKTRDREPDSPVLASTETSSNPFDPISWSHASHCMLSEFA